MFRQIKDTRELLVSCLRTSLRYRYDVMMSGDVNIKCTKQTMKDEVRCVSNTLKRP